MSLSLSRALVGALSATALAAGGLTAVASPAGAAAAPYYRYTVVDPLVAVGYGPTDIAINPSRNTAYVVNSTDGTISSIDATTGQRSPSAGRTDLQGAAPNGIAVTELGGTVYVTDLDDEVAVLDGSTLATQGYIPVGGHPDDIAIDYATNLAYVANEYDDTVSVIDTLQNTVVETIAVGDGPSGVAIDPDTHAVYVTNLADKSVSVIDAATRAVSATVPVGAYPRKVAIDPGTHSAYVTNYDDGTVSVIDTTANTVRATIRVGTTPWGVAVDPGTRTVYVTNYDDFTVSVIAEDTLRVTDTLGLDQRRPAGVAVNPATHIALVAERSDRLVAAITQRPAKPAPRLDTSWNDSPRTTFSTSQPGELLVALVRASGPANVVQRIKTVTGAGLTWRRAAAVNAKGQGAVEVWQAYARSKLQNVRVAAQTTQGSVVNAVTVRAYTGAATSLGATSGSSSAAGPTARTILTPRSADSLVVAAGLDASSTNKPVPAAGQPLVSTYVDAAAGTIAWTQAVTAVTEPNKPVTVRDKVLDTSRWSLVAVEVPSAG